MLRGASVLLLAVFCVAACGASGSGASSALTPTRDRR